MEGEDLNDDALLGGALEPEGEETVEENGGKVNYLLEEEIEVEDINDSQLGNTESNGHSLSSKFSEKLQLEAHTELQVQQVSCEKNLTSCLKMIN